MNGLTVTDMNPEQVRAGLASPDEEVRRQAVVALRHLPTLPGADLLKGILGDPSWRVRKEAVELVLVAAGDERSIADLVEMLRSEDNAGLRNSAVEVLERLGARAVPVLHRFSADPDHDVRKFIIDIMGSIRDASFVPVLVEALDDADPNVSSAAAENLGKIGDERAIGPLLEALERPDVMFRFTVVQALGRIGRSVPLAPLLPLADDPLLRRVVYDCLGAVGDGDAVAPLTAGLGQKVRSCRDAALVALYRLYRRPEEPGVRDLIDCRLAALRGTDTVAGLAPLLDAGSRDCREAAIWAAGIIGDDRFIALLLKSCRSEELRGACLAALTRLGDVNMTALVDCYRDAAVEDRCLIVHLIGESRYDGAAALLEDALADDSPVLRRVAAVAAGKVGLSALVPAIAALLADDDARLRAGAIDSLGRLAPAAGDAVHRVAAGLAADDDPHRRRESIPLLAVLRDVERLVLLAKDEDAAVRCAAVQALAGLDGAEITGHLVMALVDEDESVRTAAAGALGSRGGGEAVHALLLALQDDDPWVQSAVVRALGEIGDRVALPAITELVSRSAGLVVIDALRALSRIDGEQSRAVMVGALANPDADIVKEAMDILAEGDDGWLDQCGPALTAHDDWDVRCRFIRHLSARRGDAAAPVLRELLSRETDGMVRELLGELLGRGL